MNAWIRAACIAAAATAASAPPATGDHGSASAPRQVSRDAPLKDCTRFNGRFGYYGNPWCTPAEQARWDRREARRAVAK